MHGIELNPFAERSGRRRPREDDLREGRGGRAGRMGRLFGNGVLRLLILSLIAEQPRHGYELIKAIDERCNGEYTPSPGVVYPTLTLLEEMGLATVSAEDGGRKQYTVTAEGRAYLSTHQERLNELQGRLERTAQQRPDLPPQALRALQNIRTAVHLRLTRPMTEEQANAFAQILDQAAQHVEQI